jgi:hypothetical protein
MLMHQRRDNGHNGDGGGGGGGNGLYMAEHWSREHRSREHNSRNGNGNGNDGGVNGGSPDCSEHGSGEHRSRDHRSRNSVGGDIDGFGFGGGGGNVFLSAWERENAAYEARVAAEMVAEEAKAKQLERAVALQVGGATSPFALVVFICVIFCALLMWCECSC